MLVEECAPLTPNLAAVAAAYDAIAPDYDRHLLAGEAVRRRLWQRYARLFYPGMRVLDVGCGTGIDTLYLARRGVQVVSVDVSPGMVAELRRKVQQAGLDGLAEAHVMDLAGLAAWPPASFDGIIAAFAVLNTAPDLAEFGQQAARLLRPGGRLLVHLLTRWSIWDILALLRHHEFRAIAGRIRQRQRTVVIGGVPVMHVLYPPKEAYRTLSGGGLQFARLCGFGILTPPPGLGAVPPFLAAVLDRLERCVGGWHPLRNRGRFFLLEMEQSLGEDA
jgi:SAM-dependent methyltransferase